MKGIPNKRSTILTILSTAVILVYIYPELAQAIKGESIGDGISVLVSGALALSITFGTRLLVWAGESGLLNDVQCNFASLSLISVVIVGCLLTLYYIPDTPEAIGLLVVTIPAALLLLRDTMLRWTPSD